MTYPLPRAILFLVVAMFFMLSACEKDTAVFPNESTSEFLEAAPKNLMVFENQKALMDMFSKPVTEIKAIQSELFVDGSFTSYGDHFASIEEELALLEVSGRLPKSIEDIEEQFDVRIEEDPDGGKMIVPAVESPGLAAIANEYGIYQVGDALVQISYDLFYSVDSAAVSDFTDLSTSPGVQIASLHEGSQNSLLKSQVHECTRNYLHDGKEHRLRVQWFVDPRNIPVPGVSGVAIPAIEIFVQIRHQKRGFLGMWFANSEDRIWSDGRITHLVQSNNGNSTQPFTIDRESFNSSSLNIDVFRGARITDISPQDWILSPSWALHSSRDGGTSVNCMIVN
jgi:hypothetical protein